MQSCQLVYIPDIENARNSAVLRWTKDMPIRPARYADGFARSGDRIEHFDNSEGVRFIANADTLSQHGLTPSSQMMRLASRVIGGEH